MAEELNNNQNSTERFFTISVLTENKSGLLNGVTIIFTRRKINIESINVSESEVEGVSRYTIVIKTTQQKAENIVKQIRKLIEVLGAFLYEVENTYFQEMALYKVPTEIFMNGNTIEKIVRDNFARILVIERDHIIIEKTGHTDEIKRLFDMLKPYGILEFVKSARISISKSKRKTETFLQELEEASSNSITNKN
ncbi:MAG: acetolactate synthase small subunit [Bacteroidota bacterium]|nr:acetolactate synthase small subunit [Bacteroidota bacterium]